MADSFVRVPTDSTGKRVDATSLDVGADTVYRQRIVIGSDTGTATFAEVLSVSAVAASHGLVVRPCTATVVVASGTINVNGGVAISGTATVAGSVVISGTATVSGNINISATASVVIATASFVTTRQIVGQLANASIGAALTVKTAFGSITAAGQTIVAAVASQRIRVLGYRIQAQGTVATRFVGGSSGQQLSQLWSFQAREGTIVNAPPGCFEFESSAGEGLAVSLSGAVTADISLVYVEV